MDSVKGKSKSDFKYKWNEEATRELIAAVVSNQHLWGRIGRSASESQRQYGWAGVSKQFENVSAIQCKEKWQNLRSQQRRIARMGSGTNWKYFTDMPPLYPSYDGPATSAASGCSQHIHNESDDEWGKFGEFVAQKLRGISNQQFAYAIRENISSYLIKSTSLPQVTVYYI